MARLPSTSTLALRRECTRGLRIAGVTGPPGGLAAIYLWTAQSHATSLLLSGWFRCRCGIRCCAARGCVLGFDRRKVSDFRGRKLDDAVVIAGDVMEDDPHEALL